MNVSKLMRQSHRWLSMVFILAVLAATFAAATGQDTESVLYYLPLPPLFLMMATGVYMFFLPYVVRWRGHRAGREAS